MLRDMSLLAVTQLNILTCYSFFGNLLKDNSQLNSVAILTEPPLQKINGKYKQEFVQLVNSWELERTPRVRVIINKVVILVHVL